LFLKLFVFVLYFLNLWVFILFFFLYQANLIESVNCIQVFAKIILCFHIISEYFILFFFQFQNYLRCCTLTMCCWTFCLCPKLQPVISIILLYVFINKYICIRQRFYFVFSILFVLVCCFISLLLFVASFGLSASFGIG